jgi:hypothetical protein
LGGGSEQEGGKNGKNAVILRMRNSEHNTEKVTQEREERFS